MLCPCQIFIFFLSYAFCMQLLKHQSTVLSLSPFSLFLTTIITIILSLQTFNFDTPMTPFLCDLISLPFIKAFVTFFSHITHAQCIFLVRCPKAFYLFCKSRKYLWCIYFWGSGGVSIFVKCVYTFRTCMSDFCIKNVKQLIYTKKYIFNLYFWKSFPTNDVHLTTLG